MEVELYVYDLSKGLARQISASLLGTQIDAIYHTSIVMKGIEYVYDGGIQTIRPGQSHLGQPMQVVPMGSTELPMDVIMDYLESIKIIYTPQAYDLWKHNCNSFSNDLAVFLLGKGIPSHITNLPDTVLQSPFGRMLKPMIDDKVRAGKQRQAGLLGLANESTSLPQPQTSHEHAIAVKLPRTAIELADILKEADKSCAVIFFTSQTCPPCKPMYPIYEELAREAGTQAAIVKVDIGKSQDIAMKYQISSTPTFITFLHGKEMERWSGADGRRLSNSIRSLIQIAWPPHPHESLRLPALRGADLKPVLYSKIPPLEKLMLKIGNKSKNSAVQGVKEFIITKQIEGAAEAHLPNLDVFSLFLREAVNTETPDTMFAIVDLLRVAMADPRFSGYFAEEKDHKTIAPLLEYVNSKDDCPYPLRLVALQTGCNLFSSPLYTEHILHCQALTKPLVQIISASLLDDKHHNVRVAASSLAFNIAVANSKRRTEDKCEVLPDGDQVELAASLLEAIGAEEESAEAIKGYLLAFGYLVFHAPQDGELVDLIKSMDAGGLILAKVKVFPKEALIPELGNVLIGQGL